MKSNARILDSPGLCGLENTLVLVFIGVLGVFFKDAGLCMG